MRYLIFILFFLAPFFVKQSFSLTTYPELYYVFKEPKIKSNHAPVIVLMHGFGSNEKDLFAFANQLPDSFLIISLRAPIKLANESYAWYHLSYNNGKSMSNSMEAESSRNTIIAFLSQLKSKHSYNEKSVYLCGFSQGAVMAYGVGLTIPQKIKGIAVMSGKLLDEFKPLIASKQNLSNLRVFISHGTNDKIITVNFAREASNYIKQLGVNASYNEYTEEHTISESMFNDMLQWLRK
jgi:phospholipase/carboxylesterase